MRIIFTCQSWSLWEQSVKLNNKFPTALRNLFLAYYNKMNRKEQARTLLQDAFLLDTSDARLFLELDQLYKKLEMEPKERLGFYDTYYDTFMKRDDLYIEYVTLFNTLGNYKQAYELINVRHFHPWEGGEGKITSQYTKCLVEIAKENICLGAYKKAEDYLKMALVYPENLGEGKLEGTKDNDIYYYLGCIYESQGEEAKAYGLWSRQCSIL